MLDRTFPSGCRWIELVSEAASPRSVSIYRSLPVGLFELPGTVAFARSHKSLPLRTLQRMLRGLAMELPLLFSLIATSDRRELNNGAKTMSQLTNDPVVTGIESIRQSWGWFLGLGIAFIALGISSVAFAVTATVATALAFGWLLLMSAILQTIHSFRTGTWSGSGLNLIGALFRGFIGLLMICHPLLGAEALTVVLAALFTVAGQFRAIVSVNLKLPRWQWGLFSGGITALLGFILMAQMPGSGLWFIGIAIGVDLILEGAAAIGFATEVRHISERAAFSAA